MIFLWLFVICHFPDFINIKQLQIQEKILVEGVEEVHHENLIYAFCV